MQIIVFVVIFFLVCWGPRLIMDMLQKSNLLAYNNLNYNLRILFNLLSFCHSAVNPFVYGFMSQHFRNIVWAMICRPLGIGKRPIRGNGANAQNQRQPTQRKMNKSNTMEMSTMFSVNN